MQFNRVWKAVTAVPFVALALSLTAWGQGVYGPGTPGYTAPPGGYKASTGLLIGGAVAAAGVVGFLLLHHSDSVTGCVATSGAGQTLTTSDHKTLTLSGDTAGLQAGERVKLDGKSLKSNDGPQGFEVHKLAKDLGACA